MREVVGGVLMLVLLAGCPPEPGDETDPMTGRGGGSGASTGGAGGSTGGGSGGQGGAARFAIAPGYPVSIKRDRRGVLHAIVEDDPLTGLRYLRCGGSCDQPSSWKGIVLAPPDIIHSSMAVTPEGKVAVVWGRLAGLNATVEYSQCTAADCARLDAWTTPALVAPRTDLMHAGSRNLVFDDAGALHLVLDVVGGSTSQMYFTCSTACDRTASWVGTAFLSQDACASASVAVTGRKIGVACASTISTGQGLIYAECEESCTSQAYWRWTKPMRQSVNGGVSLAFEGGAPRVAFHDIGGIPQFMACESNCGLSTSWTGVQWSKRSVPDNESVFLLAEASGTVRLGLVDLSGVDLLTCDQSCAVPGTAWSAVQVDTDEFAVGEAVRTSCPAEHPEPWLASVFKGRVSFVVDGKDLHLLAMAKDIKGCSGTEDYTREANQRARYVHLRLP